MNEHTAFMQKQSPRKKHQHASRTSPLEIGLVGTGRWGTKILQNLEVLTSRVRVTTANTLAESRQLVKLSQLDGVIIATPGTTHARVARPFIERGLPVFIEKPMTTTLRDANDLLSRAQRTGARLFIGHIHLYNPAYERVKTLLTNRKEIRALFFEGMNHGPIRDDMSALWDWAPHDLALAFDLLQSTPHTVQAWGVRVLRPRTYLYDAAFIHMVFPGNIPVCISVSWLGPEKRKKMTVLTTKQSIVFDDTVASAPVSERGADVKGKVAVHRNDVIHYPSYASTMPLAAEMEAFLELVEHGTPPRSDGKMGASVVRILAAAEKSIQQNGIRVTL